MNAVGFAWRCCSANAAQRWAKQQVDMVQRILNNGKNLLR